MCWAHGFHGGSSKVKKAETEGRRRIWWAYGSGSQCWKGFNGEDGKSRLDSEEIERKTRPKEKLLNLVIRRLLGALEPECH